MTYKAREEGIVVVENFDFEAPKTQEFVAILNKFELAGSRVLLVLSEESRNIYLSGRNIPKMEVIMASDLNTYDILNADKLLIQEGAIDIINEHFAN